MSAASLLSPALSLALLRFGAACLGSLVIGWVLVLLLRRAAARWPALHAHRSIWLLAQAALVLAFVLACLPLPRASIAPALAPAPIALELPTQVREADTAPAADPATAAGAASAPSGPPPLAWLGAGALALYLGGLAVIGARRWRAQRAWRVLLRCHAQAVDAAALDAWPGISGAQRETIARTGLVVRSIDLPVSPMLYGLRRPTLLLPAHLAALAPAQQHLVVEHELTHWRRADPLWLTLSHGLSLLFWFSRPFQRLDAALREAVELGCDDTVLTGRDARARQGYAAALVAQLRLQMPGRSGAAPAFGELGIAQRVLRMRERSAPRLARRGRLLAGAATLGLGIGGALLQPMLSAAPAPFAAALAPATLAAPVAQAWRYPLDAVRVTALYGVRSPSVPDGHHGVDFAARRGTLVRAVAAGTVAEAAFNPSWGHYVRVDHGGGRSSLVIHLDRADVAAGQQIAAGEPLGLSGASGKATGPHLHLEYWQDGRRLDPEAMLLDLPAHASARALARRRAQGHPLPSES